MLGVMKTLPPRQSIISDSDVRKAFQVATSQAQDQAKAAFINRCTFSSTKAVDWIILVGPCWIHLQLGPFTDAQLSV